MNHVRGGWGVSDDRVVCPRPLIGMVALHHLRQIQALRAALDGGVAEWPVPVLGAETARHHPLFG